MGHVGAKLSAAVGPETPVPADGRLSRSTANWELPPWVDDGFERDEMAARCESVQAWPFLRTGVAPREGQRLYMNIHYAHDGSHPYTYRGWARMVGHVTEVLPPPPPGLYATYSGQEVELSSEQLEETRSAVPALPPSFISNCACGRVHTADTTVADFGAVHGQRVRGKLRLSCDDEGMLEPQLGGEWDIELIHNDNKQCCWVLCMMKHAGPVKSTLPEAYPPGEGASRCWIPHPGGGWAT